MKKKKLALILIGAIVLLLAVSSCYAKGPWRGKVIDAETKQPIEGAAVVAVWERETTTPAGTDTGFVDAAETVTNKEGEFEVPSRRYLSIPGIRKVSGPWFTIFKPGYGAFPQYQVSPTYTPATLFEGKGAIVELPKFKSREDRKKSYEAALGNVGAFEVPRKKIPELLKLINYELKYFGLEPESIK